MVPYVGSGPYCYANTLCAVVDPSWPPGLVETLTGSPFGFQMVGPLPGRAQLAAVRRDGDCLAQAFGTLADLHEELSSTLALAVTAFVPGLGAE